MLLEDKCKSKKSLLMPIQYNLLLTYDNLTNLIEIDEFFRNNVFLDERIARITKVNEIDTTYYDNQKSKEIIEEMIKKFYKLYYKYKGGIEDGKQSRFLKTYFNSFFLNACNNNAFMINNLRGSCIPGLQKLAVDPNGNYHMCEKVNYNFPIGNVTDNLNYSLQAKQINLFIDTFNNKCSKCNVSNLCNICMAIVGVSKDMLIISDKFCKARKKAIKEELSLYYSILEEYPHAFSDYQYNYKGD
jgi:uncharacterized protein